MWFSEIGSHLLSEWISFPVEISAVKKFFFLVYWFWCHKYLTQLVVFLGKTASSWDMLSAFVMFSSTCIQQIMYPHRNKQKHYRHMYRCILCRQLPKTNHLLLTGYGETQNCLILQKMFWQFCHRCIWSLLNMLAWQKSGCWRCCDVLKHWLSQCMERLT